MMAWERAKGEMQSILATYWGESDKYEKAAKLFEQFISELEVHDLIG
jgi:hypothetical protein